jgi:transcriptional regulator with XRE-family HTH domain
MVSSKLPNYLRTHRKRLGLSQADVSRLLGEWSEAQVSRHENSIREPSLETALAYEVIFQKPVRELFAGVYERVEAEVAERAKAFASDQNLEQRKQEIFTSIASRQINNINLS